jgi:uncharacterized membrane protein
MKHIYSALLACLLALSIFASPTWAHEAHQKDMTDAEMAQMEAEMAQMDAPEGAPSHAEMPTGEEMHADMLPAPPVAPPADASPTPADALAAKIAENRLTSTGDLLGRLHPVAAHFPIALLLAAALAELALVFRPALGLATTVRFLVAGGALGAVAAATLGWFAGGWRFTDRSETLGLHRWNGTAIALVSVLAWWLAARGKSRAGLRTALALLAAGLVAQGFLGGEMVFGPNHMGLQ